MNEIASEAEAEALIGAGAPAWILKHSSTCGISAAAYEEVEAFLAAHPMPIGVVVVQQARPLSNWLAERLKRVHQSPQLFLLQGGAVRWSASHYGVTRQAMEKALAG
jgi:bacillithiol system protein YtxJ